MPVVFVVDFAVEREGWRLVAVGVEARVPAEDAATERREWQERCANCGERVDVGLDAVFDEGKFVGAIEVCGVNGGVDAEEARDAMEAIVGSDDKDSARRVFRWLHAELK